MIILEIIGGVVVVLVLIALLMYAYFRIKFGKYLHADANHEPLAIHLNVDDVPDWLSDKKVKAITEDFLKLGYKNGSAYTIYEMQDVVLKAFFKAPFLAIVYQHKILGSWVDIALEEKDGLEHTVSSTPIGTALDERPECNKQFYPGANVIELQSHADEIIKDPQKEFITINQDNFRGFFETAYKKDISWRARKGGIDFEEFLRAQNETSISISLKDSRKGYQLKKKNELHAWHEAAMTEYKNSQRIEDEKFYDLEHRLIIVPHKTSVIAFLEYLEEREFLNEKQLEKMSQIYSDDGDVQETFYEINDKLSPELRAQRIGKGEFPLQHIIYQISEKMQPDYC